MTNARVYPLHSRHILVVEDSSIGVSWSTLLQRLGGATTTLVASASAAHEYLVRSAQSDAHTLLPAIILIDFELIGSTNGSQLACALRADAHYTHIPRACISSHPASTVLKDVPDPHTLYQAFISKLIIAPELIRTVASVLEASARPSRGPSS